jgi:AmiR/NasT family two-component response regulator
LDRVNIGAHAAGTIRPIRGSALFCSPRHRRCANVEEVRGEMERYRVLVAEDEAVVRERLKSRLEALGFEVIAEASDGRGAVELSRFHKPDIIVMDIKMPELDGIQAASIINKENPAAIVFLSAYGEPDLVERAKDVGAFAYLMKPIRQDDLLPAIKVAFQRFQEAQIQKEQIEDLTEKLETRKWVERAKGILMDRHGLSEQDAFMRIHKQARNTNRKMRDVAESIVEAYKVIE